MLALLALRAEMYRVLLAIEDVEATRRTLQWWGLHATDPGDAGGHPVFIELGRVQARFGLDTVALGNMIAAAMALCEMTPSGRLRQQLPAAICTCAGAWTEMGRICGATESLPWQQLGSMHTRLELLQQLSRFPPAGAPTPDAAALRQLLATAITATDVGTSAARETRRNAVVFDHSLRLMARALARKMLRHPGRVASEPVALAPLSKLWCAWQARRLAATCRH